MGDYDCPQAVTLANFISHNDVDVIALQEVNQSIAADTVTTLPSRYYNCSTIVSISLSVCECKIKFKIFTKI